MTEMCESGHVRTEATTYVRPDGYPECRVCRRRQAHQRVATRGAEAVAALTAVGPDGEEWRSVVGFFGLYEVSDRGRVRNIVARRRTLPGRILTPLREVTGYVRVRLYGPGGVTTRKVHQLVLEAFVGPRPDGHEVNHIDADRSNNVLTNLEYVTRSENLRHAWQFGSRRRRKEEVNV